MSIPFGFSQLQAYLVAGLALALLIACGAASCQSRRADSEHQQRLAVQSQLDTAVDANTSAIDTVNAQARALKEWRDLAVTPAEAATAVAALNEALRLSYELNKAIEEAKEKDRAKPDCEALLDADFERACPATARGLRDAAAGGHEDGDGRGAGAAREAHRPEAHR